jgi:MOSC domain-containing protein YiiM
MPAEPLLARGLTLAGASLLACVATILELSLDDLPALSPDEDPVAGLTLSRWLGGFGLGLVPIDRPHEFSWPGPWIARLPADQSVVMFGVPSGLAFDPHGSLDEVDLHTVQAGFLLASSDPALALPPRPAAPRTTGRVSAIFVARAAGQPAVSLPEARALPGLGLQGDRHVDGAGTFPSGAPGSALTLIDEAVCQELGLTGEEHRRNLVIQGIDLNALVGHEFAIGEARCRGMRLCEPCTVVQRYAGRPILRALVHRGGLRADILEAGVVRVGDELRPLPGGAGSRGAG